MNADVQKTCNKRAHGGKTCRKVLTAPMITKDIGLIAQLPKLDAVGSIPISRSIHSKAVSGFQLDPPRFNKGSELFSWVGSQ